jgi:hypothetical protein
MQGRDQMYDCTRGCGVDPRNIAQRVMEVRGISRCQHRLASTGAA